MDMKTARKLSSCGYGCYVIGGPFVAENPECPEHGWDRHCRDSQDEDIDDEDDAGVLSDFGRRRVQGSTNTRMTT